MSIHHELLFQHPARLDFRSYDVSRDGKRFIMVKDLGDAVPQAPLSSRIIVVQNWFEELKRLVP